MFVAEPDVAKTLRKSIPLVGSSTFASRPRTGFAHCFAIRHLSDSFNSKVTSEVSAFFDSDDSSDSCQDTVLCFETKDDHDSWQ
jgi:hypothetical protein